jgi:uncharacterized protein YegP (UPF0339 family)
MATDEDRRALRTEIYRRDDGKWAWRAVAGNGQIVGTDGGQGYNNEFDAAAGCVLVTGIGPEVVRVDDSA